MQEQTEQQKQMAKIKEYELNMEQMKVEGKRVDGEQKRKYLEEESKQQKYKAEYQVNHNVQLCIGTIVRRQHLKAVRVDAAEGHLEIDL